MSAGETKRCTCCSAVHDADAWRRLHFVGVQRFPGYDHEALELRNCTCGTTLAVAAPKEAA